MVRGEGRGRSSTDKLKNRTMEDQNGEKRIPRRGQVQYTHSLVKNGEEL